MGNTTNNILRIGIVGYGNLGKGVEKAIKQKRDMALIGIFTRRSPDASDSQAKVVSMDDLESCKDQRDVMVLCGGSSTDLPAQVVEMYKWYPTDDSMYNYAKIPEY